MRIALFHNLPSGGAKRHTLEQVKELTNRDYKIVEFAPNTADLVTCSFAPYVQEQRIYELEPYFNSLRVPGLTPYLNTIRGIQTLRRTEILNRRIAREIDAGGFDLVFVKDCRVIMNPFILRYLNTLTIFQCHHGLRHRVELHRPSDITHTTLGKLKGLYYAPAFAWFQNRFKADETRNIRSADRVITNSEFSCHLLRDNYKIESQVVYPGINPETFRPLPLEDRDYVLSVGALVYSKGYRFLITALAQVDIDRRPALFIAANIVDPKEESVVREIASRLEVNLHIESIHDDERMVQVYNQALVFVYAPIQEALGMAPLEAMACGTPVVAVGEGGVRETVLNGQTGYLVERDSEIFAAKLEALLSNHKEQKRLGAAGIDYVRKKWTWPQAVDRLEEQFECLTLQGKNLKPENNVTRRFSFDSYL